MRAWGVASIALLALSGCSTVSSGVASLTGGQQTTASNGKTSSEARDIARHFGVPVERVEVFDVEKSITGKYFNIRITEESGELTEKRCYISGGILSYGLTNPPQCGDQMGKNPLTGQ